MDSCTICDPDTFHSNEYIKSACGHTFHRLCIDKISKCPTCNSDISDNSVRINSLTLALEQQNWNYAQHLLEKYGNWKEMINYGDNMNIGIIFDSIENGEGYNTKIIIKILQNPYFDKDKYYRTNGVHILSNVLKTLPYITRRSNDYEYEKVILEIVKTMFDNNTIDYTNPYLGLFLCEHFEYDLFLKLCDMHNLQYNNNIEKCLLSITKYSCSEAIKKIITKITNHAEINITQLLSNIISNCIFNDYPDDIILKLINLLNLIKDPVMTKWCSLTSPQMVYQYTKILGQRLQDGLWWSLQSLTQI